MVWPYALGYALEGVLGIGHSEHELILKNYAPGMRRRLVDRAQIISCGDFFKMGVVSSYFEFSVFPMRQAMRCIYIWCSVNSYAPGCAPYIYIYMAAGAKRNLMINRLYAPGYALYIYMASQQLFL